MKYHMNFQDGIEWDTITPLVEKMENTLADHETTIHLYLSSPGGNLDAGMYLLSVIDQFKYRIEITFFEEVTSVGFLIYILAKSKTNIRQSAYCGIHLFDIKTWHTELKNENSPQNLLLENLTELNIHWLEHIKKWGLGQNRIEEISKSKIIYIESWLAESIRTKVQTEQLDQLITLLR